MGDAAEKDKMFNESEFRRQELVFRLVYIGFLISGIIALLVIGGVISITIVNSGLGEGEIPIEIPSVLENWGGVIVGFYFGAFVSLIKDFMKM